MPLTQRPPGPATTPRPPAAAWFPGPGPGAAPAPAPARGTGAGPLRLICVPYAGGTASVYRGWETALGADVRVVPVALPGRGPRLRERPYSAMHPLARDLAEALVDCELAHDYALFGHSMGALLAYEVACELRARGHETPRHLFVSGSAAPTSTATAATAPCPTPTCGSSSRTSAASVTTRPSPAPTWTGGSPCCAPTSPSARSTAGRPGPRWTAP